MRDFPRPSLLPSLLSGLLLGCQASAPTPPATPPAGIDLGSAAANPRSATRPPAPPQHAATAPTHGHAHHHAQVAPGDVPGHGVVDAIDPGRRRVALSHDPMPEIGWPAMTMVFPVPASADFQRFKPGHHVDFTLRKGAAGSYDLIDIRPGDH